MQGGAFDTWTGDQHAFNGATFQVDVWPQGAAFFGDELAHVIESRFGQLSSFEAGVLAEQEALYLGNRSTLQAPRLGTQPALDPARLTLRPLRGLSIASDFAVSQVCQQWDSTGVDVTLDPIAGQQPQPLEMISRPVMPLFNWYSMRRRSYPAGAPCAPGAPSDHAGQTPILSEDAQPGCSSPGRIAAGIARGVFRLSLQRGLQVFCSTAG